MATCCQNGALPVGRRKLVQETFLCVLVCSICVPNFVCPRQSGRRGGKFKPRPLPFGHAHFQKRQILKFFTEPDVCAKFPDFSLSFRPPKMRSFREKKKERKKEELKLRAVMNGPSHLLPDSPVPAPCGRAVPRARFRNRRIVNCFTWPVARVKFRDVRMTYAAVMRI